MFVTILMLGSISSFSGKPASSIVAGTGGTINVLSTPGLYPMASMWAAEYSRLNPKVNMVVTRIPEGAMKSQLKAGEIGFVSRESDPLLSGENSWNMVVGRDVIVPVMSTKNSFAAAIARKGISPNFFKAIFQNKGDVTWGMLLGNSQNTPVRCYVVNEKNVVSGVADFTGVDKSIITMRVVENGAAISALLKSDPDAIGFCRLGTLMDASSLNLPENIRLVPIDKNGNGTIDYMEKIYDDPQAFARGVWIGKYPRALSGNIYAVAASQPVGGEGASFLMWVVSDGQKLLGSQGISDLVYNERESQMNRLNYVPATPLVSSFDGYSILKIVLLIFISLVVIGSIIDLLLRVNRKNMVAENHQPGSIPGVFDENSVVLPKGLFFDKTHTWAFMEKDGSVKLGVDDFMQHITGTLTRIEMREPGEKIRKGDPLLTMVHDGKQLHLYAPVSGTITAHNKGLLSITSMLNTAPYTDGWVYLIEPANWLRDIQFLSMADRYKTWLKDEFSRLKDFFAAAVNMHTLEFSPVILQDGGDLTDNLLADLNPKVWEDFQRNFIDKAR